MSIRVHHIDKWAFINLDLINEMFEKRKRCAIVIGGATSSGKSYSAEYLENFLNKNNIPSLIISTDHYNKGISGIVTDKVNEKYFNSKMPHKEEIRLIVREIIKNTPFEEKFSEENCLKIKSKISNLLSPKELNIYLNGCKDEFSHFSFDEPYVYDLKEVAHDVKILLSGKSITQKKYSKITSERIPNNVKIDGSKYKVIIIEGIYVLTNGLLDELDNKSLIANFVEGTPKSLFLRRVIRDQKITSLPGYLTISMYFNYIAKSYKESIQPSMKNADVILDNNMSFAELREGTLYMTKERTKITNPDFLSKLWNASKTVKTVYQKDIYIKGNGEPSDVNSIIRMRELSDDKGKTYKPSSLVSKGVPKYRRDMKEIRPINILLSEQDFPKVFNSEEDFLNKVKCADFVVQQIIYKTKRYLRYKGFKLVLTEIPNDGIYLELTDPRIDSKTRDFLLNKATK